MAKPWTVKHVREACARSHELVAVMVRERGIARAPEGGATHATESDFRWWLNSVARLDAGAVDREVRRVRALAEGRLVRQMVWRTRGTLLESGSRDAAVSFRHGARQPLVRVARIRRAT